MDSFNQEGFGKSREQHFEDQLAAERRLRGLERELERERAGQASPQGGRGGARSGAVVNGANGAAKGSVIVVWDFGEYTFSPRMVAFGPRGV